MRDFLPSLFKGKNFPDDQPVDEDLLPRDMPEDVTMHKVPTKRPIHENLLAEMEHKRKQLTLRDAELVSEINAKHEDLASTRMALRAVEDMMRAVRENPIVPPVIQNMTEKRKQPTAGYVQQASRLQRPGYDPIVKEVIIDQDAVDQELKDILDLEQSDKTAQ